ncbi:MAG: protein translocase subunit SecF [Alphaproteobacteria bacterium]|nr:protein translocase subunit SecF [Alphaproteobacteria bacterium]
MQLFPRLRLVPDGTQIQFMKGRHVGLIFSALLSALSVILYFAPGLNYGIDFKGGIVIEARGPEAVDFSALRPALSSLNLGQVGLQQFGSPQDVLIRLERQRAEVAERCRAKRPPANDQERAARQRAVTEEEAQQCAVEEVRAGLERFRAGMQVRRVEAVGGSISRELFVNGMLALGFSLLAMLAYIWFRFEWQFGVGAVITLVLDVTKVIGFYVLTGFQFNLTAIAAILTIMGYSINDKVVVYDRMRENLRKFKTMPLRQLIDLSINETLSRTIGTSMATFLATIPLALFGGEALEEFAVTMLFGIILATSSSIFIAAPILLLLGEDKLRRGQATEVPAQGDAAAPTP